MKKLITVFAVVTMILAVSSANATITWSIEPVFGTAATLQENNGDIHLTTDSGDICIPAYQNINNPCAGTGVSMNVFVADPETRLATVAHASSVNINVLPGYTVLSEWYLDGQFAFDNIGAAFPNDSGINYELSWGTDVYDIGRWTYIETWTSNDESEAPISLTTSFTVVPEPLTLALLCLGGLMIRRKK
jgi:hypothetical protein